MGEISGKARLGMTGFDAGRSTRRLRSLPTGSQSINAQIKAYGSSVLARSRYLAVNNPYAAAAKEAFVASLVGDGIKPASAIKDAALREEVQAAFLAWTDEADADWLTDFYGLQALIGAEMFEAGECFVRIRPRDPEDGLLVPFQLQLLPAEMLPHSHNRDLPGGGPAARIEMGIEFNAIGRRDAYHFLREHPSSGRVQFGPQQTVRVPASEVLHLFRPTVAGQIRGVPHTVSAVAKLAMMDQYDDAELERKRVAAMFGGFVTSDAPEAGDGDNPLPGVLSGEGDEDGLMEPPALEPGLFVPLAPGEDVKFAEPADVGGSYEAFQYRTLTSIAAGFGVPYYSMTGDLRQTSYSSIRSGMVDFRRRIRALQHHVMVYQFCRPVFARWMQEAVLAGAVPISPAAFLADRHRMSRAVWHPPHWEWVDPLKDMKAEQLAVECGFKSRSDVIEATGQDPHDVDRKISEDLKRATDMGLKFGPAAIAAAAAAGDENEEDESGD